MAIMPALTSCASRYRFKNPDAATTGQNPPQTGAPNQIPPGPGDTYVQPTGPVASPFAISANPLAIKVGQSVNFVATGCGPNNEGSVAWQFGDSRSAFGAALRHSYSSRGDFLVQASCVLPDHVTTYTAQIMVSVTGSSGGSCCCCCCY